MPLLRIADLEGSNIEPLIACGQELSDLFDKWEGRDQHERPAGIHASEISGCARRAVYTMLGTQKMDKPDTMWLKKFRHGHWVHSGLQREMHSWAGSMEGKLSFRDEVPINPYNSEIARQFEIYSSADGIFTIKAANEKGQLVDIVRVGLEIKTCSPAEFEKLSAPKDEHIEQVTTYMACLDVPCFWLLYYNKGNENTTPSRGRFFVRFQHSIWNDLAGRFSHWHDLVEQQILPDQEVGIGCEWCAYRWTCNPVGVRNRTPRVPPASTVTSHKRYAKKG